MFTIKVQVISNRAQMKYSPNRAHWPSRQASQYLSPDMAPIYVMNLFDAGGIGVSPRKGLSTKNYITKVPIFMIPKTWGVMQPLGQPSPPQYIYPYSHDTGQMIISFLDSFAEFI